MTNARVPFQRDTWTSTDYSARCEDCSWHSAARNAQGNAARHTDATGHTTVTAVFLHVTYCNQAHSAEIRRLQREQIVGPKTVALQTPRGGRS